MTFFETVIVLIVENKKLVTQTHTHSQKQTHTVHFSFQRIEHRFDARKTCALPLTFQTLSQYIFCKYFKLF